MIGLCTFKFYFVCMPVIIYTSCDVPLKNGLNLQTVIGLRLANCPYDTSMKNRGIPQSTRNVRYGIRKTAVTKKHASRHEGTVTSKNHRFMNSESMIKYYINYDAVYPTLCLHTKVTELSN